jgi:uncharacterized protein CbrC (UPF0167 family)
VPEISEYDLPQYADLYLLSRPPGGIRDIHFLSRALLLGLKPIDMKRVSKGPFPILVREGIDTVKAVQSLQDSRPDLMEFLSFRSRSGDHPFRLEQIVTEPIPRVNEKSDELPTFKYHPDPISSDVIEERKTKCVVCNQERDFVYTGAVYAIEDVENICPWCIKDGSAAEKFEAEFFDDGDLEPVDSPEMVEELTRRTPGFYPAHETWPAHCGDFCKLLGEIDYRGIVALDGSVDEDLNRISTELEVPMDNIVTDLKREHSPLWAHLFQCLHCDHYRLIANYE